MSNSIRTKTLEFIKNNPERWDQGTFVSNDDIQGVKNKTVDCGTSFCLAGTAAYMTPAWDWDSFFIEKTAQKSLNLDIEVAEDLFYFFVTSEDNTNYKHRHGCSWYVTHEAFVDLLERLFRETDDTIMTYHMLNVLPDWEKDNNVGYR